MDRYEFSRTLHWYLPVWIGAGLVTLVLGSTHMLNGAIAALLWIALFSGAVGALALVIASDSEEAQRARPSRRSVEALQPLDLMVDVLPPARTKPLDMFR